MTHLLLVDRLTRDHWHSLILAVAVGSTLSLLLSLERSINRLLELLTIIWHMVASRPVLAIVDVQLVHYYAQRGDQLE